MKLTEKQIALVVLQTIFEVKIGAPGGVIYAALMTAGVDFETFTSIMSALERSKLVEKKHDCWFPGKKFQEMK